MRIVCPSRLVLTEKSDFYSGTRIVFKPYTRYVVSDWEHRYLDEHTPNTTWSWSSFNSYERRYAGQDINNKKVVLYRHSAFGDQLIATSVPRYLRSLFPDVKLHTYCDPAVACVWKHNPDVDFGAIPIPMPFDAARNEYDYHIFYEGMLENNGEWDQDCCYDDFFNVLGLYPDRKWKRPAIYMNRADYAKWDRSQLDNKILVYNWTPANKNRCYPFRLALGFLELFHSTYPDWHVWVVGLGEKDEWYGKLDHWCKYTGHSETRHNTLNKLEEFRDLAPLVEAARLVVCPDSAVMHLAAAFGTPTISLWGLFNPNDRTKYYPHHYPIFPNYLCPHAPCHNHNFTLPVDKCVDAIRSPERDEIEWCNVLAGITPAMIMEKVGDVVE